MKTVTICGSMRFKNEMMKTSFMLELDHHFNVLQCVYNTENKSISESEQKILEEAHFKKIEISDAIYVLDINGYIGKQVTKEIEYAESLGKEIIYDSKFIEEPESRVMATKISKVLFPTSQGTSDPALLPQLSTSSWHTA